MILLQEEVALIQSLRQADKSKNFTKVLEDVFESDGYSLRSVLDSDVLNPVDSYNLIKRTARTWLKVKDALINIAVEDESDDEGRSFLSHLHSVLETFPSWEKNRCFAFVSSATIIKTNRETLLYHFGYRLYITRMEKG